MLAATKFDHVESDTIIEALDELKKVNAKSILDAANAQKLKQGQKMIQKEEIQIIPTNIYKEG